MAVNPGWRRALRPLKIDRDGPCIDGAVITAQLDRGTLTMTVSDLGPLDDVHRDLGPDRLVAIVNRVDLEILLDERNALRKALAESEARVRQLSTALAHAERGR